MKRTNGQHIQSNSLSPNDQRQRQRPRDKKTKVSYYMGPDLHLTKHYYFITKYQKNIQYTYAVWNFSIIYGKKPSLSLIVCDSQTQIYEVINSNKYNKKIIILSDNDHQSLKDFINQQQPQIVLLTSKKASILCAIQEAIPNFNLIINLGFHRDLQHYRKLHEFIVKTGGTIISFITQRRDLQKIQQGTGLNFTQISGTITDQDINKQILNNIQFMPPPKQQTLASLKLLPFSTQQLSLRIFQLFKNNYLQLQKSKYLQLIGYITYQVKTDVQFNSYKYIWNYLKDTLPDSISDHVRNMIKFKNGKGALFNIPIHCRYQLDRILRKIKKHAKGKPKLEISVVHDLPQIENIQSQQYKLIQQKKAFAMRNKNQLQIFVSGLPTTIGQQQIRQFFLSHNVNPLTIRLMKDRQGQSRGICFILCQDQQHLKRSLSLDQFKFEQNIIRIHLAQRKQKKHYD